MKQTFLLFYFIYDPTILFATVAACIRIPGITRFFSRGPSASFLLGPPVLLPLAFFHLAFCVPKLHYAFSSILTRKRPRTSVSVMRRIALPYSLKALKAVGFHSNQLPVTCRYHAGETTEPKFRFP